MNTEYVNVIFKKEKKKNNNKINTKLYTYSMCPLGEQQIV